MRAGTVDVAQDWKEDLIIVVEMGFGAKGTKSCGLYTNRPTHGQINPREESFGSAVQTVSSWLRAAGGRTALVVEAPLSYFWDEGSPCGRLSLHDTRYLLERRCCWSWKRRRGEYEKRTETRYWYVAPGSTVALAAGVFLQRLSDEVLPPTLKDVHVFEGFASFKGCGFDAQPPPTAPAQITHAGEAEALAKALPRAVSLDPPESVKTESILDRLGIGDTPGDLPAVVDAFPGAVMNAR